MSKAFTTWADADDFRHFLPRLLELCTEPDESLDLSDFGHKLMEGEWKNWPEVEEAAILEFTMAEWRYLLSTWDPVKEFRENHFRLDGHLCGIAAMDTDLTPYLFHWGADSSPSHTLHLASFVANNAEYFLPGVEQTWLTGPYWAKDDVDKQKVLKWLLTEERVRNLREAYKNNSSHPHANLLKEAADQLEDMIGRLRAAEAARD